MAAGQGEAVEGFRAEFNAQREADRVTVNQFAPPGVLIDAELQILLFRGPTGAYLTPPTGKASFDVLKMGREGLMLPLRAAINKAKKDNKAARKENVRLQQNGKTRSVNLEVIPLKNLRERCFLIVFEDAERAGRAVPRAPSATPAEPRGGRRTPAKEESRCVVALESELAETRDYLQSIQEQHEAANEELQASNEEVQSANEELQASNEEVQSANEELQSINEELETSKEELESANEELTTVNEEMANRNTELKPTPQRSGQYPDLGPAGDRAARTRPDHPTLSAQAEKQFNLLATDIGRPFSNVRHNLVFDVGQAFQPAGSHDLPVAPSAAGRKSPNRRTRRSAPQGSPPDLGSFITRVPLPDARQQSGRRSAGAGGHQRPQTQRGSRHRRARIR
jgi:two-component system CheB/CheR fusion protein